MFSRPNVNASWGFRRKFEDSSAGETGFEAMVAMSNTGIIAVGASICINPAACDIHLYQIVPNATSPMGFSITSSLESIQAAPLSLAISDNGQVVAYGIDGGFALLQLNDLSVVRTVINNNVGTTCGRSIALDAVGRSIVIGCTGSSYVMKTTDGLSFFRIALLSVGNVGSSLGYGNSVGISRDGANVCVGDEFR